MSAHYDFDLVLLFLGESDCLPDFSNYIIFFVSHEGFGLNDKLIRDGLHFGDWLFSLFTRYLHEDSSLPVTSKLRVFVDAGLRFRIALIERRAIDIPPSELSIPFPFYDVFQVKK